MRCSSGNGSISRKLIVSPCSNFVRDEVEAASILLEKLQVDFISFIHLAHVKKINGAGRKQSPTDEAEK